MDVETKRRSAGLSPFLFILAIAVFCTSCATIDVVHFTSETFPPTRPEQVEVLSKDPSVPYVKLAQITIPDSRKKFTALQRMIMDKASAMGADAVIFKDPETRHEHKVSYSPVYRPWGYYSPYYGYGGSYMTAVPSSSHIRYNTLTGTAIKFKDKPKS